MLNPFKSEPKPKVVRSRFFPDTFYVGKFIKLDPTIKHMMSNLLFGFPTSNLTIKGFKYFEIDTNKFEEIVFDKADSKDYIILNDTTENNIYFLNRVMSTGVTSNEVPPMACQDVIEMDDNGTLYQYDDMSGLIETKVHDDDGRFPSNRLIRVYSREVNAEDSEYLICIMDNTDVVHYYLGFIIGISQLEDI